MAGLSDHGGLFQPLWFYDKLTLTQYSYRKSSVHSPVVHSESSLLWQDRWNDYPPSLCTHPRGLDYSLGDLRIEICGDDLSLLVSQGKVTWPHSSCTSLCGVIQTNSVNHEPHYHAVPVSLNSNWTSIHEHLWLLFLSCVSEPQQILALKDSVCCEPSLCHLEVEHL